VLQDVVDFRRKQAEIHHASTTNLAIMEDVEMAWNKPRVVEVCLGMEINCYDSAEV